jgi:trehalose 6-phosphate phosphatase
VAVRTTEYLAYPKHVSEEVDLLSRALGDAYRVFLFIDYDGTLVPQWDGVEAEPSPSLLGKLEQLSHVESFSVYVMSGRTIHELDGLLGLEDVGLIGQSGFEIRRPGGETTYPVDAGDVRDLLQRIELEAHGCLCGHPGVEVVHKGFSIALRHRACDCDVARCATQCFSDLVRSLDAHGQLEVFYSRGAIEARMAGWRKGDAVGHVLRDASSDDTLAIYLGDAPWIIGDPDAEEDSVPRSIPILVSPTPRPTTASLFVRDPHEVYEFLSSMTAIATALM